MAKINWKVRLRNPVWWGEVLGAIFLPMLTALGISWNEITSWEGLLNVLKNSLVNPVIVVAVITSVWNTIIDPTTKGVCDSERALEYEIPFTGEEADE